MATSPSRSMHLVFLAHLWVCVPFLVVWVLVPSTHALIPAENFQRIVLFVGLVVVYLAVRTWLAWRDPPTLKWEYVFPPIDVGVVSMLIWLGNRDPLSNIALLYFFPLAQAAATLNWRWSVAMAAMVLLGVALATHGLRSDEPFNAVFRYFLLFVLASLLTMLARASANVREQLGVAKDRNRMAVEMHDGVQGHLMVLSKQLELVERMAVQSPQRTAEVAAEGRETARIAADELRYLVDRMRSPSLDAGFTSALRNFIHNISSRSDLDCELQIVGDEQGIALDTQHTAFRIVQESLTNALRHSGASHVLVLLQYEEGALRLTVRDNGKGCDVNVESEGIAGMIRRARALGGNLTVNSLKDEGTEVVVTLPKDGQHAH